MCYDTLRLRNRMILLASAAHSDKLISIIFAILYEVPPHKNNKVGKGIRRSIKGRFV